ncbi:MAG: hypothetical protein AAF490_14875 [Chloroflexota bacterium]
MSRQSREQARRLSWLTEAQAAIGWGIILFIAALLGAIYVRQASRIATIGRRVQVKQIDLVELKRDNSTLEQGIAEAQSLDRLQSEAIRLGFVQADPEDIEYIVVPEYPPESAETAVALPTSPPQSDPLPETIGEALWLSVRNNMSGLVQGEARE